MDTVESPWQSLSLEEFDALWIVTGNLKGLAALFHAANPEYLSPDEYQGAANLLLREVEALDGFVQKMLKREEDQDTDCPKAKEG